MRIPLPGRGYWARKQFGKPARRTPLPTLAASATPVEREFVVRGPGAPTDVQEPPTGPVADRRRLEALEENKIRVPDVVAEPHPLVARTVTALRRAKPNAQGYLVPTTATLNVDVTLDGADHAMCIFDALLKALDARGFFTSIRPAQQERARATTIVRIGEEDVAIGLSERVDAVERQDPPAQKKPGRVAASRHAWSSIDTPTARIPRRELVSTGQFTLRIDHSYLGVRCRGRTASISGSISASTASSSAWSSRPRS
jgi:hypothetical protein